MRPQVGGHTSGASASSLAHGGRQLKGPRPVRMERIEESRPLFAVRSSIGFDGADAAVHFPSGGTEFCAIRPVGFVLSTAEFSQSTVGAWGYCETDRDVHTELDAARREERFEISARAWRYLKVSFVLSSIQCRPLTKSDFWPVLLTGRVKLLKSREDITIVFK